MNPFDPPSSAHPAEPPRELEDRQLERLRAAGDWARVVAIAGGVAVAVSMLAFVWLAAFHPKSLIAKAGARGDSVYVPGALLIGCVCAVVLVAAYERNVAAWFKRPGPALARAFRHLRHFFVLWTCVSVLTALSGLLALWRLP